MTGPALDPRLAELAGRVTSAMSEVGAPLEPPTPAPGPGQSRTEWLAEVARARARNDDRADVLTAHLVPRATAVATVADHDVPVPGATITARVYTPPGQGPFPGIVYFHGGAWWLAGGARGFALNDGLCRTSCAGAGAVVVNVDYRLSPERPFPHQPEDCFAALEWVVSHALDLDVDPADVSVMGTSSGANQAAAVCLMARQRGGPAIAAQVLHVPVLDLTGGSPSLHEDPAVWADLDRVAGLYATAEQRHDPHASPLLADDLTGLPPTVVVVGTHDPLRDDGRRYAERLADAGVDVRLRELPMLHTVALPETTEHVLEFVLHAFDEVRAVRAPR